MGFRMGDAEAMCTTDKLSMRRTLLIRFSVLLETILTRPPAMCFPHTGDVISLPGIFFGIGKEEAELVAALVQCGHMEGQEI